LSEAATCFPFGTPSGWESMSEESTCGLCGVDLGEDLHILSTIKLDAVKLGDDTLVIRVQAVLDDLSIGSILLSNNLLLLDCFFNDHDRDISSICNIKSSGCGGFSYESSLFLGYNGDFLIDGRLHSGGFGDKGYLEAGTGIVLSLGFFQSGYLGGEVRLLSLCSANSRIEITLLCCQCGVNGSTSGRLSQHTDLRKLGSLVSNDFGGSGQCILLFSDSLGQLVSNSGKLGCLSCSSGIL